MLQPTEKQSNYRPLFMRLFNAWEEDCLGRLRSGQGLTEAVAAAMEKTLESNKISSDVLRPFASDVRASVTRHVAAQNKRQSADAVMKAVRVAVEKEIRETPVRPLSQYGTGTISPGYGLYSWDGPSGGNF